MKVYFFRIHKTHTHQTYTNSKCRTYMPAMGYTTIIKCQAAKVLFVVIWLFLRYHLYFLVSRRLLLVNYMFTFFVHANMYNVVYIYLVYNIKCIQIYIMRGRIRNFLVWGAKIKGHILSICVFLDPLIIAIVNFKHQH